MLLFTKLNKKVAKFQGDSGGPLTVSNANNQHELVGATSWGIGCNKVRKAVKIKTIFSGRCR